jgi:hypothetical protein
MDKAQPSELVGLKPCPFCGGTSLSNMGDYISCETCNADGPYAGACAEAWNTRPAPQAIAADVIEAIECLTPTPEPCRLREAQDDGWWMIERDDAPFHPPIRPMYFMWDIEPGSAGCERGRHNWTGDWQKGARFATKEEAEAHTNGDPLLHVRDHAMMRLDSALSASPAEPEETTEIARLFHEAYERLAPQFGYETRRQSAVPWDEVPENNRRLMIATVSEVLAAMRSAAPIGGK